MKYARFLGTAALLLLAASSLWAQAGMNDSAQLVIYPPEVMVFGPEQAAFSQNIQDIYFSYNGDNMETPAAQEALRADAQWLKDHPSIRFYVDGYADWRGDIIYNVRLAQRRANTVKQALIALGIPEDRMIISTGWGKLYPLCAEQSEECWHQNRRAHLVYIPTGWTRSSNVAPQSVAINSGR